jgi:hypothetical protein
MTPNIARMLDVERRIVAAESADRYDEAAIFDLYAELDAACAALTDEERNS